MKIPDTLPWVALDWDRIAIQHPCDSGQGEVVALLKSQINRDYVLACCNAMPGIVLFLRSIIERSIDPIVSDSARGMLNLLGMEST